MPLIRLEGTNLELASHPLTTLALIAKNCPHIKSFNMATYKLENDGYDFKFRDREYFEVSAADVVEHGIALLNKAKQDDLDLVVDSRIQTWHPYVEHLLLIDFNMPATKVAVQQVFNPGERFRDITETAPNDYHLFQSGRSLHGYNVTKTLPEDAWRRYMASLLLIPRLSPAQTGVTEDSNKLHVVDSRWVGHRLMQGAGALRLSRTNSRYLQFPRLTENPSRLSSVNIIPILKGPF